jgi:hypothetical protein
MTARSLRIAGIAAVSAGAFAAAGSVSGADETPPATVYGTVGAIDPLAGSDWAPPVEDGEVAALAQGGATVTEERCGFGDRPGVLAPQIFRRTITTTGHFVVTPSGNATLVCHAAADQRSFQRPLPTSAIVVDNAPCFLPGGRRTNDSHLVVTPSLHVHLVCHVNPA